MRFWTQWEAPALPGVGPGSLGDMTLVWVPVFDGPQLDCREDSQQGSYPNVGVSGSIPWQGNLRLAGGQV